MERTPLEEMLAQGMSVAAIAEHEGLHPSTVTYWIRKHGLTPAGSEKHSPRGGIPRDRFEQLIARNLTVREIAEEVDRSVTTVRHWLRRYGLETTYEARTKRSPGMAPQPRLEQTCAKHGLTVHARRRTGEVQCVRCRAEAVSEWRRRTKRTLVEEAGGACAVCGFDRYVGALHFHHLDPTEKRFGLAGRGLARSIEALRAEARKCVLLCSNCHAQVEAGVLALP